MIYMIVFSLFFMSASLKMNALTTSRIYLMLYLIDITNIDKIYDYGGKKNPIQTDQL